MISSSQFNTQSRLNSIIQLGEPQVRNSECGLNQKSFHHPSTQRTVDFINYNRRAEKPSYAVMANSIYPPQSTIT